MSFDPAYALTILPDLLRASLVTLGATVGGFALAVSVGAFLAIARMSRSRSIRLATGSFVEFVRATPLLIQLFVLFYVLPNFGIVLDPLSTGIVALGLHYSAYTSEVYRAGIESVPQGQWEVATALNFSPAHTWRRIVLPQAIPPIIPALGNYLIGMFKDTAVLAVITVRELLGQALTSASATFRYVEPFVLVALIYLAFSVPAAYLVRRAERRVSHV